jgi:hypothetical protein
MRAAQRSIGQKNKLTAAGGQSAQAGVTKKNAGLEWSDNERHIDFRV